MVYECTCQRNLRKKRGKNLTLHSIKTWILCTLLLLGTSQSCPGIIQYQVSFQTGSVLETENISIAECTAGRCRHIFEPSPDPLNCSIPQWLLRMWQEWELQEDAQHNPSVSYQVRLGQDPVHPTTKNFFAKTIVKLITL